MVYTLCSLKYHLGSINLYNFCKIIFFEDANVLPYALMPFAVNEIVSMNFYKLHSGSVPIDIDANAVKLETNLLRLSSQLKHPYNGSSSGTSVLDQEQSSADDANLCSTSPICEAPIIRQFWKAGVYNDELTPKSTTQCIFQSYFLTCFFFL